MTPPPDSRRTPRAPMAVLSGACLALAAITALDTRVVTSVHNHPLEWSAILDATLPRWLVLAVVLPLLFHIAWRRPPWPATPGRVLMHVGLFVGLAVLYTGVQTVFIVHAAHAGAPIGLDPFGVAPFGFAPRAVRTFSSGLPTVGFMYGVILLLAWGIAQSRARHARDLRSAQLETQLRTAQLSALRAQLHPHFLYNTLNSIAAVASDRQPERAVAAIEQLADLLHASFRDDGREVIPLREEVALAERYLALQRLRFGDRLRFSADIDAHTAERPVPVLILQPLIENAVRHGMAGRAEPIHIGITAAVAPDGTLAIAVANDGAALASDWEPERDGLGLANTRARLETAFGSAALLSVTRRDGGGVVARLVIPADPEAAARPPEHSGAALQPA